MKLCVDCGKKLGDIRSLRCRRCANIFKSKHDSEFIRKLRETHQKGKQSCNWKGGKSSCLDCGKRLSNYTAKRCGSCARKFALRDPKNHPNYRHGKAAVKHYCIDCGKVVGDYRHERCMSCSRKGARWWRWKGGAPKCLDCGKQLARRGAKRCGSCSVIQLVKDGRNRACLPGDLSPNWIDGRSYEPYTEEWTPELKERIRKRDNYTCQVCGMVEEEHLIIYGRVLTIHHIDYSKKNCQPDNLAATCLPCNARVNYNREYWKEYLGEKILESVHENLHLE